MQSDIMKTLLKMQKNEITEHNIYRKLSASTADEKNKKILEAVTADELNHYHQLKKITRKEVSPSYFMIWFYFILSKILGLSFGLKLMEKGETLAVKIYDKAAVEGMQELTALSLDEQKHEKQLLSILKEEHLEYAGAMVLGLNDALVELTGALAGLTFAFQNNRLIALAGLVTGIAASMSMAASGYLSSREEVKEEDEKSPLKAAIYTGTAYIITVIILVLPYFIFASVFLALAATLICAVLIIFCYTFYITTAKGIGFWHRFIEMAFISLGVAVLSFFAGAILKQFIGIEI